MKTIGFIDYCLSEWHANNYPQWINDACERLGLDYTVAYAWGEQDISPVDGVSGTDWCNKMGVTLCSSIEEVCEKSDALILLAPSNPEKHLPYAEKVLSYGKPTYIDKTFAPNLDTAKAIFALGEKYNTPFFSTSALRYATELEAFKDSNGLVLTGGGSNFPEYAIHLVEMAVVLSNRPIRRVKVHTVGSHRLCCLQSEEGKCIGLVYGAEFGFAVSGDTPSGQTVYTPIQSDFFPLLMEAILRFFEDGRPPFDSQQTLQAMAVRDALLAGERTPDTWVCVQ